MKKQELEHSSEFVNILKLKEKNFLLRILLHLYINITGYFLIYSRLHKNHNALIIYHHDLLHRKDIDYFLIKTEKNLKYKASILIFKRKFKFSSLINFLKYSAYQKYENDINQSVRIHIKKFDKIIIFFPHSPAGSVVQKLSSLYNKKTAALQHGYYRYFDAFLDTYIRATRSNVAFIFDRSYSFFFKNCKRIYVCGNYFVKPEKIYSFDGAYDYIFLSVITLKNINLIASIIKNLNLKKVVLVHHPHTDFYIKLKLSFILGCWNIQMTRKYLTGFNNFFIDTTVWKEILFPAKSNIVFIDSNSVKPIDFNHVSIAHKKIKSFSFFINKLNTWISTN